MKKLLLSALIFTLLTASGLSQALSVTARVGDKKAYANAVFIKPGYALTSGHVTVGKTDIHVDGKPASVLHQDVDLSILKIDMSIAGTPLRAAVQGELEEPYMHVYFDRRLSTVVFRRVTLDENLYVQEGFIPGMSGSAVYDSTGRIVLIAETTVGFGWNSIHILGILEKYGINGD